MTFQFRQPVRADIKPLIGLYGQSGSGKTYSSLLMARGLVGPEGRLALIDTESGRGSLYADQIPGGYDVLDFGPQFSPERYMEALQAAEAAGYEAIIIDSVSHEWEGPGGVLDQAAQIEERTGKKGLHCWNKPKMAHAQFVQALLRSSVPVIVNMRAKYKSRQVGKEIVKDDHTSPIQADDFIFEMTIHAEVMLHDHSIRVTKHSHPALSACLEDGSPISIKTGEAIGTWCRGEMDLQPANEILEQAKAEARKGREPFQEWWTAADQPTRKIANTIMKELQRLVEDAEASDEVPF